MWALRNLREGFARRAMWSRLAFVDIQQLYKRSLFGLAWVALSFGAFITVKVVVFGTIARMDLGEFGMWVAIGFWLWMFATAVVVDGARTFASSRAWILGTSLPLSAYVYQTFTRAAFRLLFALPVVVLVIVLAGRMPELGWLWAIPGMIVFLFNAVWVILWLGCLGGRYNDVIHLAQTTMQVLFFLTPILYMPSQLGSRAALLNYNPFTHYLAIVRDPIIFGAVPVNSWIVVGAITVMGWYIAIWTFQRMGRAVPFYVA